MTIFFRIIFICFNLGFRLEQGISFSLHSVSMHGSYSRIRHINSNVEKLFLGWYILHFHFITNSALFLYYCCGSKHAWSAHLYSKSFLPILDSANIQVHLWRAEHCSFEHSLTHKNESTNRKQCSFPRKANVLMKRYAVLPW